MMLRLLFAISIAVAACAEPQIGSLAANDGGTNTNTDISTVATPETRGQQLFASQSCKFCHATAAGGSSGAPNLFGVAGSQVTLLDGSQITADDAYLAESIKTPNAKIVKGHRPGSMPTNALIDSQISDLVAYLKSLK